jgi:1-aminocyclopropane-1-carboxylate deaminase
MFPAQSFESITLENVSSFYGHAIEVSVLRLDKIHPVISGNKWFKLRFYIEEARRSGKKGILTFGGAWSNHIVATAAACHEAGLASIGIIRGEEPAVLSPTLEMAKRLNMRLAFISRADYRDKQAPATIDDSNYLIVGDGGYGSFGAKGASTILDSCPTGFSHYCCAVGTGTMLAGIINRLPAGAAATGLSVMKNNFELGDRVKALLLKDRWNWKIVHDFSFGGYAKHQPVLIRFMNEFFDATGIPSDFVYTAKLFYGVQQLVQQNFFPGGSRLLLIHSGGLQGNTSLPKGTLHF